MTVLVGRSLLEAINTKRVVEGFLDPDSQVGQNGVDLSLRNVYLYGSDGSLGEGDERVIAYSRPLKPLDGWFSLKKGSYKIDFNEVVRVPKDMIALTFPRSTLIRNGVSVEGAVWDSGFYGRGEALMVVHNSKGFRVKKGARIVQMVLFRCSEEVPFGYSGRFQGLI